jgi:hypothetical protein
MLCTEKNDKLDLSKIEHKLHNIKANEEVNMWWQYLCSELSETLPTSLLTCILKLYMTIRFSLLSNLDETT